MKIPDATMLFEQYLENIENLKSSTIGHFEISASWFENSSDLILNLIDWYFEKFQSFKNANGTKRPVTNRLVLDPFMGLGTVLKIAREQGIDSVGIDINPVAWFFAKVAIDEVAPSDFLEAVERLDSFQSQPDRILQEELQSYYHTNCPCKEEHTGKADILRMHWIQTAICSNAACQKRIPLFENFIIHQKKVSVNTVPDVRCNRCNTLFDWDEKEVSLIAESNLNSNSPNDSAGVGRSQRRWAVGDTTVLCPSCKAEIEPDVKNKKTIQKKVALHILYCPYCQSVWQYRGTLPQNVRCPSCGSSYYPKTGNVQQSDLYSCPFCGTLDKISDSLLSLSSKEQLPFIPYAIEGYCQQCHRKKKGAPSCAIQSNKGRFFKKVEGKDLAHYLAICQLWSRHQEKLNFPVSKIARGKETMRLFRNNYFYWFQLFNGRQLLSFATILEAIIAEENERLGNLLLLAFLQTLESNNVFANLDRHHQKVRGIFESKQMPIPYGYTESNLFGAQTGENSFRYYANQVAAHLKQIPPDTNSSKSKTKIHLWCSSLESLTKQGFLPEVDLILTEPPLEGDSRFMEWSDFYYVWLRQALKEQYAFFSPEHVHRIENLNQPEKRRANSDFYFVQLRKNLGHCLSVLKKGAKVVLIMPVLRNGFWPGFLETLFEAGLQPDFIVPLPEISTSLKNEKQIKSWKLIFVCQKFEVPDNIPIFDYSQFIHNLTAELSEQYAKIRNSSALKKYLTPSLIRFLLLGEGVNRLTPFYFQLKREPDAVSAERIHQMINMCIDGVMQTENNLPQNLIDIDPISYLYFKYLCDKKTVDALTMENLCQGIADPNVLIKQELIHLTRMRGERIFVINEPLVRYEKLKENYFDSWQNFGIQADLFVPNHSSKSFLRTCLIDIVHLALGLAFYGENLRPWLAAQNSVSTKVLEACSYLKRRNVTFEELIDYFLQVAAKAK